MTEESSEDPPRYYRKIGQNWFVGIRDSVEPPAEIFESQVPPLLLLLTALSEQGYSSDMIKTLKNPQ